MMACQSNLVGIPSGQSHASSSVTPEPSATELQRCGRRRRWLRVKRLLVIFVSIVVAGWIGLVWQAGAQDAKPQAGDIQDLEVRFRSERSAAESAGWLKKFSPELAEQADQLAQKGQKALVGGRQIPARQLFAETLRKLPAPPANFPDHFAPVFGDPNLRHGYS